MMPHASSETIERLIVGKAVDHLLKHHDTLRIETGNKVPLLHKSKDVQVILASIFSHGEPEVWIFTPKRKFLKLVLGNGPDVISDYSIEIDDSVRPAINLALALEA
jgi:hypothetical protein